MAAQFSVNGKQLVSNGLLGLDTANPMSLVGWINSTSWNNVGNPISILGMYSNPGYTGVQIGSRGSNGLDIWTWGGGMLVSSGALYSPVPGYFHVGYTWDGTYHNMYASGNFIVADNSVQTAGVIDNVVLNGFLTGGGSETSNSIVDEIGVYDRALSLAEMGVLAKMSIPASGILRGLIAYYGMDEGSVGSVISSSIDYTGNGNTLVATGTGADETYAVGCSVLERLRVQS